MAVDLERLWAERYPQGVPRHLDYPNETLDHVFLRMAARRGPAPAALFLGETISWRRLGEMAGGWAKALGDLGIVAGDRVALALPNCPQMVAGFFGTLLARAVVVPVNPLYVERELETVLSDSGARVVLALDRLRPRLAPILSRHPEITAVYTHITDPLTGLRGLLGPGVARRGGNWADVSGERSWKELVRRGGAPSTDGSPEDLAVLQYTGGTTGEPKGVMLTHRNLLANAIQSQAWSLVKPGEVPRVLAVLPFFHVYGLTVAMNLAVVSGGTLVLMPRFDAKELVVALERQRPDNFPGTPTMYVAVLREAEAKKVDLSSVRACISGSAPLPMEVQTAFEARTGGRLVEGYGLTEASPVTHANPLTDKRKNGTVGLPFPDTEAQVVADDGRPLGPGEGVGELWVRGPQVMKGYWRRPDATAEVLTEDGWLKTGDIARLDEDGHFAIVDRKKDIIIAGGFNIYPREVEEVLLTHPAVAEAAAFGVPDAYRGQTVKAALVLRPGQRVTPEELTTFLEDRLARYKIPKLFEFREALPKSTIGKTLRRTLLEEHLAQGDGAKVS